MRPLLIVTLAILLISVPISAPRAAETVVAALPEEPAGLDPHLYFDPAASTFIFPCYQRLVGFKPGGTEPEPELALTWRISDDGLLYTFVLRQGQVFSDNRPVNAETVRASFQRALGLGRVQRSQFPTLADIQILGPCTIRFVLTRQTPDFVHALASSAGSIVSPGASEQTPGYLEKNTLGSGSYTLRSWEPGREIVLSVREDLAGRPAIERFVGRFEASPAGRLEMVLLGQADAALKLDPDQSARLEADPGTDLVVTPVLKTRLLALNCRRPWLDRPEARRALALAIDRHELPSALPASSYTNQTAPLPRGMWGVRTDMAAPRYDSLEARAALDRIGRPDRELVLVVADTPARSRDEARIIVNHLEAVGLKVKTAACPEDRFETALKAGEFDLALVWRRSRLGDPQTYLLELLSSDRPGGPEGNTAFYANPVVDDLLRRAGSEKRPSPRLRLFERVQKTAVEDTPYVFFYQLNELAGISKWIGGADRNPLRPLVLPLGRMTKAPPREEELEDDPFLLWY
ncbi:MAG: ABC transporter substrate-binding protein [Proteobacteria bacterium]|nr:ABC transporter substrate-binding protein [Pseudomonadota bacterium]